MSHRSARHRVRWPLAAALLGCLLVPAGGCRLLAVPFFAFGRDQTKKIPAEYPYLDGKRVALVVWAEDFTQFEYPHVRLEVSEHVRIALESGVRDVNVVPNREVIDYQNREPRWEAEDPATLGKQLGAQRLIMIELTQYTTREPGSLHLYRGHMGANVKVYDTEYANSAPTYKTSLEVAYPPDAISAYGTAEPAIRRGMMETFAVQLAGKFYERQEPVK